MVKGERGGERDSRYGKGCVGTVEEGWKGMREIEIDIDQLSKY